MRIALDMQACQTASRDRGIGRYSMDLTRALLTRPPGELLLGLDGTYPTEADEVADALLESTCHAAFSRYYYPGPVRTHGHPHDIYRPAADVLVGSHYRRLSPDIIHVHSLFEGFVGHAGGMPGIASLDSVISSVTVYDFIPLIFADQYLVNPEYKAWYLRRLAELQRFDLLLCISEASRTDAMRYLGLPPERLAVIHAGVGKEFKPRSFGKDERLDFLRSVGIRGRYVLYTGNGDFRKNLFGAIDAFSRLPHDVRQNVQLVLNQVDNEASLRAHATRCGLAVEDLVVTGKVSNEDLISLFQTCEVFFFPSLYEGFGLPVLEAMACGAPTICGDNSSLREVMQRQDAMFDASSPEAAAGLLAHALLDEGMRISLREYGLSRVQEYSWERAARLAGEAWQEAHARAKAELRSAVARPPRKRIAMVTPLLPQRTGVASYVAEILAPLSRYFELDLYTSVDPSSAVEAGAQLRVRLWSQLPERVGDYDCIIYQFGNSPFHSQMVDLLARFPGVVVLHDVFLSSMFWYMGEHGGVPGAFEDALMRSHGRPAVALLRKEGPLEARKLYPASLGVLESATAVIVHSAHSLETIQSHYPYAHGGRIHIAPMPVSSKGPHFSYERRLARERLSIAPNECLVVSFGFIAESKLSMTILHALDRLRSMGTLRMVFVGENDGGTYGQDVARLVKSLGKDVPTSITGFVDEATYHDYLVAADIAIQLRAGSRGETSKAIYDCMAHALPAIVNDYGSLGEVPDDCVRKLSVRPTVEEMVAALSQLVESVNARISMGLAAVEFMRREHTPDATARVYASVVQEAIVMTRARNGEDLVSGLAHVLEEHGLQEDEAAAMEYAIARGRRDAACPRLLLDLSEIVHMDYATGVHRAVRNLAREMLLLEAPTQLQVAAVAHDTSGLVEPAEAYVEASLFVPSRTVDSAVRYSVGDILFLLDSAWETPERFDTSLIRLAEANGRAAALIYDLIPLRHPEFCVDYMPAVFEKWLRYVVARCDLLVCISAATALDLQSWIREVGATSKLGQRIGHVHLGCDLVETGYAGGAVCEEVKRAFEGNVILMVGTIEPRKGCETVLDAIEAVWRKGSDQSLVLMGRRGWNVECLIQRIEAHPELGKRLFWFRDASDVELTYAYQHASALIQASFAEGFGLPIVEASRHRLPLLLSDLPVFKEIAAQHASYFRAGDSAQLTELLGEPLPAPPPSDLGVTWRESAKRLLHFLMGPGGAHLS